MQPFSSLSQAFAVAVALALALTTSTLTIAATGTCTATSGATVPAVLELYTSEGCDSCPPADRWLSKTVTERASDTAFIPLAFHVDYWDYIGWKDAFAQPAFGKRQAALAAGSNASGVYTPQIFVNGREDRSWTAGAKAGGSGVAASVKFSLVATWLDDSVLLSGRLAEPTNNVRLRYAVTENGLVTAVKAGENKGVTLRHDGVVRAHGPVAFDPVNGAFTHTAAVPRTVKRAASRVHLIAEDARGAPLAAATVLCSG